MKTNSKEFSTAETRLSNYENCICYLAFSNAEVVMLGKWYFGQFPFMCIAGSFKELVKNEVVEQVEDWPVTTFKINRKGIRAAFDIWKKHGYHPFFPVPGIVSILEKEAKW
jgi:hypothetical protein